MVREVNIIVACANNTNVIGKDGNMPWHLPLDLKYFKARTEHQIVIMGRKTYESIGKALPNRINIVISSDIKYRDKVDSGVWTATSYSEALKLTNSFKEKEVFVIGGGKVYEQAMKGFINYIYVTWVNNKDNSSIYGDTFFPKISDNFENIDEYKYGEGEKYDLTFTTYKKI